MIKHIVMFKFQNTIKSIADAKKARDMLLALKDTVPVLRLIEVGINEKPADAASDLVLVTEFDSFSDLEAYIVHPEHQKVGQFIKPIMTERRVVDYTF